MITILLALLLFVATPATALNPTVFDGVIVSVYDCDTVLANIVLTDVKTSTGQLRTNFETRIRIDGIAAPEVRGAERKMGIKCREHLAKRLVLGERFLFYPAGKEKYGRWRGTIYHAGQGIGSWLISEGWAKSWDGQGKPPTWDPNNYPVRPLQ